MDPSFETAPTSVKQGLSDPACTAGGRDGGLVLIVEALKESVKRKLRHGLSDNGRVGIRRFAFIFLLGVLCLAADTWQTATDLPGVDWHGISGARKDAALKFIRAEQCTCGCNMKMAECRMKDPACSYSRKETSIAMKGFAEGKSADAVRAEIKKEADKPPPVLEDPVKISIAGDPVRGPENARVTIVEFSDFQCPFCSEAVAQANAIVKNFPKDVKLVFKQFPLDSHAQAEFGAEAALAAQAQGKFWEMHDRLYGGFPDLVAQDGHAIRQRDRAGREPVHGGCRQPQVQSARRVSRNRKAKWPAWAARRRSSSTARSTTAFSTWRQ